MTSEELKDAVKWVEVDLLEQERVEAYFDTGGKRKKEYASFR